MAYGLHLTRQLNNGQATITKIMQWLEKHLDVGVGSACRRWHAISNRKRVTPTKFIDQLRYESSLRIKNGF